MTNRKKYKIFFSDDQGTSILEFAIITPFFMVLMFGAIQMGIMLVALNALDAAAREASRFGITGTSTVGLTRVQSISQAITVALDEFSGGIVDPSKISITATAYPSINVISQANQAIGNSYGTSGQAVIYKIQYNWDTLFPIFGPNSIVTLTAQTVVVNEKFS